MNVIEFTLVQEEILTSNQRLHQFIKANRTKNVRTRAGWEARGQGFAKMEKAHCLCILSFSSKQRRDPGNWYPTAKAAIDGFIDVGLLPDDDHTHLLGPDMRIGTTPVAGKIHLRFEFREIEPAVAEQVAQIAKAVKTQFWILFNKGGADQSEKAIDRRLVINEIRDEIEPLIAMVES